MTSFPRCLVPVVTVERLTKICSVCNSRFFFIKWPSMKSVKVKFTKKHFSNFLPKSPRLYCKELALDVCSALCNGSNKRQMWWFTAHSYEVTGYQWSVTSHAVEYPLVCYTLVLSRRKSVFIVRCSSHAWDQGGVCGGSRWVHPHAGRVTQSVKDVRPASFF